MNLLKSLVSVLVLLSLMTLCSCGDQDWSTEIDDLQSEIDDLRNEVVDQNVAMDSLIQLLDSASSTTNSDYELGETLGGYEEGTSYQVETDGFLTVQYIGTIKGGSGVGVKVYADTTSTPQVLIGDICTVGVSTFPIKADHYFRVEKEEHNEVSIYYTPLFVKEDN